MKTISASEVRSRFDAILDEAQREPIIVRSEDRDVAVVISMADFDRLQSSNVQAFLDLRTEVANEAAKNGLTDQRLTELLNDTDA
jgi:prevent-host-death family protein